MAVRLLAGPFKIRNDKGNSPESLIFNAYWPGVGILAFGRFEGDTSISTTTYRIALDGLAYPSALSRTTGSNNSGFNWWPLKKRMVTFQYFSDIEYVWEPRAFFLQRAESPDRALVDPPNELFVYHYVKFEDKWVYPKNNRVGVVGLNQSEGVEGPVWSFQIRGMFCGRHGGEVFGVIADGSKGQFYHVEDQNFASPVIHIGMTANALLFAPEWGVLISCHESEAFPEGTGFAVRIWSLEVDPQTLTNPEPYIGTPKSGQVVVYRVRLTGAQDDPAEGELVDWSVTGAGTLIDPQSKTDADGYATARVQYQIGETGDSLVEASVQC